MAGRGEGEKLSWQRQRDPPDRSLGSLKAAGPKSQRQSQNGPTEDGHMWTEARTGNHPQAGSNATSHSKEKKNTS